MQPCSRNGASAFPLVALEVGHSEPRVLERPLASAAQRRSGLDRPPLLSCDELVSVHQNPPDAHPRRDLGLIDTRQRNPGQPPGSGRGLRE